MRKNFRFNSSVHLSGTQEQSVYFFQILFGKAFRANIYTGLLSRYIIILAIICLSSIAGNAQTTYDFSTAATLSYGAGAPYWKDQANITIDGVDYKLTCGGNGSFTNASSGGSGNSKCLMKDGSGGDQFTLQRADGQPFQFYGFWVKHQSMNSYAAFYSLPPFYSITYSKTSGGDETYNDNTAMQGGSYTTSATTFTKDLTVTAVSISFKAIIYFWIDDIKVGPAVSSAPSVTSHPPNRAACAAGNTSFSITASNATGYQWQVNTGSGYSNISNGGIYSGATSATLTLTGVTTGMNGYLYRCIATGSGTATSNAGTLTISNINTSSFSQTNVACNGGSNGSAAVSSSGGISPYTYSWAPSGGTASMATGLSAGIYTVTVTDDIGCTATKSFTITQPVAMSVSGSKTDVSCNGSSNGTATVSVSGGTPGYTYSWSPIGGTAAAATGLAAGTYTCTITDANSCQTTKSFTITQPAAMLVSGFKTDVSCNGGGNGTATVSVSGGTPGYTYSWAPSGGTAAIATGLAAGTYTCTITDANSCQTTKSFTIAQPASLTATATPSSATICAGETTDIALSSTTPGTSFSWTVSTISGSVSGASASSGSAIAQTLTGKGIVKYTITPGNGVCTGTPVNVSVAVEFLTVITDHPSNSSIDEGENTSFTVTAAFASSYQWQVDEGEGFVNVSNNETYSGAATATLSVSDVAGSMSGYAYRCVVSGSCASATSNSAVLSVRVRAPQTITFAPLESVVYGSADFSPGATSDAGLGIIYTSSDESIATIVNGKIHIKKAGQVTITAAQAGDNDYKPASPVQQILTITKKQITVSLNAGPVISKAYDGNNNASLAAGNYSLSGIEEGDEVSVSGTAAYSEATAGTDKPVTVTGFVLGGSDKDNYDLTTLSAQVTGVIASKEITVTLNASPLISKTYNGNSAATLAAANYSLHGVVGEDEVSVSGTAGYSDKEAETEKTITVTGLLLAGADKDNYHIATTPVQTTGEIKAKAITLTLQATPAVSKQYDGNTSAALIAGNYELSGVEEGDDLLVSSTAVYDNRHAGTGKLITANEFILSGTDKNNYMLTTSSATTTGSVTAKALTVTLQETPAVTKQYDGNTDAVLVADNYKVEGVVGEDDVHLNYPAAGVYENKHGGEQKNVTVSGLEISGEDAGDYTLEAATVSGNIGVITKKIIEVTAIPQTKIYGGQDPELTYTAEGKLPEDVLPGTLQRAEGKNVGSYAIEQGSLSGGDDYLIEAFQGADFTITRASLVITADDKTRKQGTANPVFTFSYDGLAEGDQASDLDTLPSAVTSATTASPIGYYDIVPSGAASGNYNISYANGKFTVAPSGDESYNVKAWSSSPNVLQVRIYTTVAQKAAIILFTEIGQQVILQQQQLSAGINSFSIPVGRLASSTYVLTVAADKFIDSQKVKIK